MHGQQRPGHASCRLLILPERMGLDYPKNNEEWSLNAGYLQRGISGAVSKPEMKLECELAPGEKGR